MSDNSSKHAELEKLKKIRNSAVDEISWGDKNLKYNSPEEIDVAIRRLEHELGLKKRKRTRVYAFDKGF